MRAKILAALIFCLSLAAAQAQSPVETGVASFYGRESGPRTASGERFDPDAMTAAHRTLPFGAHIVVCHSGCVTVRINDRGPWVRGRHIDLSPAAARAIGLQQTGHVTISAAQ
jgi:rare lipoprotein A